MAEGEVNITEIIKNMVELMELITQNQGNNLKSQEKMITSMENIVEVLTIHENRIRKLEKRRWWSF